MTHVYDRDGRAPENLALVKFAGDMLARHHAWFPVLQGPGWRYLVGVCLKARLPLCGTGGGNGPHRALLG
jgi:hypothetical protein